MDYLFFDIECADGGKGTICSYGYVLTDEHFNEIMSQDIVMNPEGHFHLRGRKGRPDVELAYPEKAFLKAPKFDRYYDKIKNLMMGNPDRLIVGHSTKNDADFLNKDCKRYGLPYLSYRFADTQMLYSKMFGEKNQISLENALAHWEFSPPEALHESMDDARSAMRIAKKMCEVEKLTLPELLRKYPGCMGESKNGISQYESNPEQENYMKKGSIKQAYFFDFLNNRQQVKRGESLFGKKKITFSGNYEYKHFKEMIYLVKRINLLGGKYTCRVSDADIFVSYDVILEDGRKKTCKRENYATRMEQNGKTVEKIPFAAFLAMLDLTEEDLQKAPVPVLDLP